MVFSIEVGDEKRDVNATKDGVAKAEDPHETVLDGDETRHFFPTSRNDHFSEAWILWKRSENQGLDFADSDRF